MDAIDFETARQIVKCAQNAIEEMNRMLVFAKANMADAQFRWLRAHTGQAMGELSVEVLFPLYRQHPSLCPEPLRESLLNGPSPDEPPEQATVSERVSEVAPQRKNRGPKK